MWQKYFIILCILIFPFSEIIAGDNGAALPGAFLRIPTTARANGMGSAFTGAATDASASWWNPAGLGYLKHFQITGMYSLMSMDRNYNFASMAFPLDKKSTLAFHWQQFGVTKIDGRDHFGNPTSPFDDNEMAFGVSYAFKMGEGVALGVTGKYLQHALQDFKATGYAMDAGLLINIKETVMLGFVMQDIIGELVWKNESEFKENIPKYYRAGIAIRPLGPKFMLTFDATSFDLQNLKNAKYYQGAEFWIVEDKLALRGGLADGKFTAGISIGLKLDSFKFRLDFAYLDDALESGATKQISFLIGF